jgi:hypothetical protein
VPPGGVEPAVKDVHDSYPEPDASPFNQLPRGPCCAQERGRIPFIFIALPVVPPDPIQKLLAHENAQDNSGAPTSNIFQPALLFLTVFRLCGDFWENASGNPFICRELPPHLFTGTFMAKLGWRFGKGARAMNSNCVKRGQKVNLPCYNARHGDSVGLWQMVALGGSAISR